MKLIIIGIDGATFDFLKPLSEQGKLPNITSLMNNGIYSEMNSTIPPLTALAWPSFFTGVNPGKHGVFDFTYMNNNNQVCLNNFNNIRTKTLWDYLGENGFKSVVINVPITYPPKYYDNNVIISGILTPENKSFCNNKEIEDDLKDKFGDFIYYSHIQQKHEVYSGLRKSIISKKLILEKDKQIRDVSIYLLNNYDPDVLITVFMSVDHVKHLMWSYRDRRNIFYDKFGDCIEKTYVELDRYIGKIINHYRNRDFIIISDHGWGDIDHIVYINSILRKRNLLHYKEEIDNEMYIKWQDRINNNKKNIRSGLINFRRFKGVINNPYLVKLICKLPFKYSLYNIFSILLKKENKKLDFNIDFNKSKAWLTSRPSFSININADDKLEYERIIKDIKLDFQNLKCDKCGKHLIAEIFEKKELYWGKNVENAPDIIIIPKDYDTVSTSSYRDRETTIRHLYKVNGWHKLNGVFIASGPNIKNNFVKPTIYDVVPTVLNYFDITIPKSIDGKPLDILKVKKPKFDEINIYNNLNKVNII